MTQSTSKYLRVEKVYIDDDRTELGNTLQVTFADGTISGVPKDTNNVDYANILQEIDANLITIQEPE